MHLSQLLSIRGVQSESSPCGGWEPQFPAADIV